MPQTYTLNCVLCNAPYYSKEGFPKIQVCDRCGMEIDKITNQRTIDSRVFLEDFYSRISCGKCGGNIDHSGYCVEPNCRHKIVLEGKSDKKGKEIAAHIKNTKASIDPLVIAIDFDGTIAKWAEFPGIGEPVP